MSRANGRSDDHASPGTHSEESYTCSPNQRSRPSPSGLSVGKLGGERRRQRQRPACASVAPSEDDGGGEGAPHAGLSSPRWITSDAPGVEAHLAVVQVEAPEGEEAVVEAQRLDRSARFASTRLAPAPQRLGVVQAEAEGLVRQEPRRARDLRQALEGGEHAAGEDVLADEVARAPVLLEGRLVDGDGLDRGAAAGLQAIADLAEIRAATSARPPPRSSRRRRCGRTAPRGRGSPGSAARRGPRAPPRGCGRGRSRAAPGRW